MSGKSRNKGKRGEREAAAALIEALGIQARRGVQYSGGNDSPDIATSLDGVHFEVKRCEALRLWPSVEQAKADARADEVPVVLHRANRRPWLVVVELEHLALLARIVANRSG